MKDKLSKIYALAVFALLLWGSAFVAIRAGLKSYEPVPMALLRFLVISSCFALIAVKRGVQWPTRREWPFFLFTALMAVPCYHVSLNMGERAVTASAASLILSTLPLWSVVLSKIFLQEDFRVWTWVGLLVSFFGAVIISFGESHGFDFNHYVLLVFFSAVAGSVYTILLKKLLARYDTFSVNCLVMWLGTLMLLPFAGELAREIKTAAPADTLAVIYMGIFPGAMSFIIWAMVLRELPVSRAVSFLFLVPIFATIIGWLWLRELPSALSFVGGVVILGGVMIVNRWGRHPTTE